MNAPSFLQMFGRLLARAESPLQIEARNLRANITESERALGGMQQYWALIGAPCCPGCMFGQKWTDAYARLKRQVERLHWLEAKIYYARGQYGPLPEPYFSWEL